MTKGLQCIIGQFQTGVRQMQTTDLQTRAWVSQTSASYRYIGIGIDIGIYSIYSYR